MSKAEIIGAIVGVVIAMIIAVSLTIGIGIVNPTNAFILGMAIGIPSPFIGMIVGGLFD